MASLGGLWLEGHGLSEGSEALGLSSRVPRAAPSLKMQTDEPVEASHGPAKTATLTIPHYERDVAPVDCVAHLQKGRGHTTVSSAVRRRGVTPPREARYASLTITGPRESVATAACSRGNGSRVASPHLEPGCAVVDQKVSLEAARPTECSSSAVSPSGCHWSLPAR